MSNRSTAADHEIAIYREMESYAAAMFIGDVPAAAAAKAGADKHSAALTKLTEALAPRTLCEVAVVLDDDLSQPEEPRQAASSGPDGRGALHWRAGANRPPH